MDELIGKTFGPYTIIEQIGEGGMAVVYKGFQESLNRHVAIKVLRGELARDQEFITRFRREALSVAKLSHPNILHVYDAGQVHGMYYMAMDYADGGSLKDVILKGPLSTEQAVTLGIQLADALDYAHRQGLVHRDVKPSNVLLTSDGRPLLTDFGIAKALHEATHLTRTGTSIGTPDYMSPEQLQGQPVDGRTDIYALGIVLFEMLAGWSPFTAPTAMATLYKQMNEPPPPLRQVNVTIPEWLEEVVNKALAKKPEERYQRGSDLADALRQGQTPVPVPTGAPPRQMTPVPAAAAPPAATVRQPTEKRRRKSSVPILVGLIGVVLLALVVGGGYLLLGGTGGGTATDPPPTVVVVVDTPEPTETLAPTSEPTLPPTSAPTTELDTPTPVVMVITATPLPTSLSTPTPLPTDQPTASSSPTEVPTLPPTSTPAPTPTKPPVSSSEPGVISDFENFGTWTRGDEANGTFTQSSTEVHQGSYSGKLSYNFGTGGNDYVVFQQTHAVAGQPTQITAWVYGDGQGHFLNAWIKDAGGQVWQVPLGRVTHTGWQQMVGSLDVNQDWPWTHISGTDNGVVDYPITFQSLVLDDGADTYTGSSAIYIDDLRAETGVASPDPAPTKAAAGEPTSPPPPATGVSGRIAYSAGGSMHVVDASTGQDRIAPVTGMYQPDFRLDGQVIIVNGEGAGKTSMWTINANSGAFGREQGDVPNNFRPFWSPDGSQFAFDSFHHGGPFKDSLIVYKRTVDSQRNDKGEALNHGGQAILGASPVWMQDNWVAFTGCDYWPGGSGGSKCGIYRMPSWGGPPAMVVAGAQTMRATDNHGAQLVYMSQDSGNWEVYIVPSTGGSGRNLSNSPSSHDGLATFSPDGKLVAFVSNRGGGWAVWMVSTAGGSPTKLFNLPAKPSGPTWDWTGERISWGP
jgi:serine/threonine-protein kinase